MTTARDHILDAEALQTLPLHGLKLIEASAGTGKTHTIANLYLRYVLDGLEPRQLLVVTFTNAATDELRGRIRQRLHRLLRQLRMVEAGQVAGPDGDAFEQGLIERYSADHESREQAILRLTLAVRSMDEAAIHTIHGFCQRALTDHAFHSGQSMDVTLLTDDSALWEEALQDWWRRRITTLERPDLDVVMAAIAGFDALCRRQRALRGAGERRLFPEPLPQVAGVLEQRRQLAGELQQLAAIWEERAAELGELLLTSKALSRTRTNGLKKDHLPDALEALGAWWRAGDFGDLHPAFHLLCQQYLLDNVMPSAAARGGDPALEDPFLARCQAVLDTAGAVQEQLAVALLYEAHLEAGATVEQRKRQRHVMAYSDQLTRLSGALSGENGETLAAHLRERFPVAMIDEFQDTDPLQYGIFRCIYPDDLLSLDNAEREPEGPSGPPLALIMIGDPKQAIYSFRGGDIFTYMEARRSAEQQRYTLGTNWRSTPGLIEAVNTLFRSRDDAFLYRDAIDFEPVAPADREHRELQRHGKPQVPLTFWQIPMNPQRSRDGRARAWSKQAGESMAAASTASRIAQLLDGGSRLGEHPLQAGDIAVLVRTHGQAALVRGQLAEHGIAAVTVSRDSVFDSDEARGLLWLLRGIVHCHDRGRMRQGLGSSLLGYDHHALAAFVEQEERWLAFATRLRELHDLWQRRGFMVAFQHLMQVLDVGARLAGGPDPERRMTNVLQLAELIQQQSVITAGMEALLAWFEQQLQDSDAEQSELRLESDSALVHIITIHASKGLQYPVVFLPFLSTTNRVEKKKDRLVHFHDEAGRACTDLSPEPPGRHLSLADRERLAEDVRLLYVAVTRAEAKLYVAWGDVGSRGGTARHTALAWLLYSDRPADGLAEDGFVAALGEDEEAFAGPLRALQEKAPDVIETVMMPEPAVAAGTVREDDGAGELDVAGFSGRIDTDWRIASFSALTRDVHQIPHGGSPRTGLDPILDFPAGSRIGLYLHAVLEELDFTGDVGGQTAVLHRQLAPRYGLDVEGHLRTVCDWMEEAAAAPLGVGDLTLSGIAVTRRLNELAFDFSVSAMDMAALNRDLSALAGRPMTPIAVDDFRGLVTGVIDLVFEHEGRFYLADYKSNHLGGSLDDYRESALEQAVLDRRYDVQYLLYALALHRYLRQRLPDYEYERHFGGAFYFFLRGMRSEYGAERGIWHRRPDRELMERLDRRLSDDE
ncbi:MAG: exodeoxyribonuclease V subunit beta [Pseudohongiellaceae bacterium]